MGQLTLARFRGDTVFGLASRLLSTFFGGLTGLVIWYVLSPYSFQGKQMTTSIRRYISCGSERGNAFGLAAVCGVCFPFFFFVRLYAPISPVTNGVYFATICLVCDLIPISSNNKFKDDTSRFLCNRLLDTHTRMYISHCLVLQGSDGQSHGYVLFINRGGICKLSGLDYFEATFRSSGCGSYSSIVGFFCRIIIVH